jgi:hypothetical protein
VGAIAKRFIGGMSASAKADDGAPRKAKRLALGIHDLEITFHPNRAVAIHCDFRRRHFFS